MSDRRMLRYAAHLWTILTVLILSTAAIHAGHCGHWTWITAGSGSVKQRSENDGRLPDGHVQEHSSQMKVSGTVKVRLCSPVRGMALPVPLHCEDCINRP